MGRDKGLLRHDSGETWAERACNLLGSLLSEVYLSLHPDQKGAYDAAHPGIQKIYDSGERKGPAGGLIAAHLQWSDSDWLVLACDMIHMGTEQLRSLLEEGSRYPDYSIVLEGSNGPEPLAALYRSADLHRLQNGVGKNGLSLRRNLDELKIRYLKAEKEISLDNYNTPDGPERKKSERRKQIEHRSRENRVE